MNMTCQSCGINDTQLATRSIKGKTDKHIAYFCHNCQRWASPFKWIPHRELIDLGVDIDSLPDVESIEEVEEMSVFNQLSLI